MHILLIHQAFAALDEPGGTRHHELALHLAGKGHRVTVIASAVSYLTGAADGARIPWMQRQENPSHNMKGPRVPRSLSTTTDGSTLS